MARILIVDDERMMREMFAEQLAGTNYEVNLAGGGAEALDVLKKEQYDLLLLDVAMPELDGAAVLRELHKAGIKIKVIAISGGHRCAPGSSLLKLANHLGANRTISKPCRRDELVETVKSLLENDVNQATVN